MVSKNLRKIRRGGDGAVVSQGSLATSVNEDNLAGSATGKERDPNRIEQETSNDVQAHGEQINPAPLPKNIEAQSQAQEKDSGSEKDVGDVEPDLESGNTDEKLEWSMKQGFFVNMGGFAFDTREARGVFLPQSCPPILFLTTEGIEQLSTLHPGICESITTDKIDDKSKAGGFGKTLVCFQALWFMAQCLSRLAQGLPISLLELNTSGHCICALIIYVLWWHKPLDVGQPILISGEVYHQVLAWMWMNSFTSFDGRYLYLREGERIEFRGSGSKAPPIPPGPFDMHHDIYTRSEEDLPRLNNDPVLTEITLNCGEELLNTGLYYSPEKDIFPQKPLTLSRLDMRRWILAAPLFKSTGVSAFPDLIEACRGENWEIPSNLKTTSKIIAWMVLISSSVIYGGLHMLAWNAPFQTKTEQILWRISAPSLMVYGLLFAAQVSFVNWNEDTLNFYFERSLVIIGRDFLILEENWHWS